MARAILQKAVGKKGKARPSAKQFRFGYLVHDVSRIRRTLMDQAMRPLGITRSQWSVLSTLSRGGNDGMMQVDLARLLELGKVTVGGLVERLEASGLVERRPDIKDRRAKRVFITEQGFDMLGRMIAVATDFNDRILDGVPLGDLETAERTLLLVKNNMKAMIKEPASGGRPVAPGRSGRTSENVRDTRRRQLSR